MCRKSIIGEPIFVYKGYYKQAVTEAVRFWGRPIREIPILNCCGQNFSADYLEELQNGDKMYRVKIGSALAPVVGHAEEYPITFSEEEADALAILSAKQGNFFKEHEDKWVRGLGEIVDKNSIQACRGLSNYWKEQGIEHVLEECIEHGASIPRGEILEMAKNDMRKAPKVLRIAYVIPALGYLRTALPSEAHNGIRWNIKLHKEEVGKVLLTEAILSFPMIEDLEWMRVEALAKLGIQTNSYTESLITRIEALEKQLSVKQRAVTRQTQKLEEQETSKVQLQIRNDDLTKELARVKEGNPQVALYDSQRIKIRSLKALITEMRQEIETISINEEEIEPVCLDVFTDTTIPVQGKLETDRLVGKTVGIIGGFSEEVRIRGRLICEVLTASGKVLDEVKRILTDSDIIVVLTQHVSHGAMWLAKEYAVENDKPIFFSRHENVRLILEEVSHNLT